MSSKLHIKSKELRIYSAFGVRTAVYLQQKRKCALYQLTDAEEMIELGTANEIIGSGKNHQ